MADQQETADRTPDRLWRAFVGPLRLAIESNGAVRSSMPKTRIEGQKARNRLAADRYGPPAAGDESCPHPGDTTRVTAAFLRALEDPDLAGAVIDLATEASEAADDSEREAIRRRIPTRLVDAGDAAVQADEGVKQIRGKCDGCGAPNRELLPQPWDGRTDRPIRICRQCDNRRHAADIVTPRAEPVEPSFESHEPAVLADMTLEQIVDVLPDRQKIAVRLEYLGYSRPEIADMLGVSTPTVHSYIGRAQERFRRTVDRDDLAA